MEDRVGQRPAGDDAERAGDDRDDQRLGGDQPPHLARRRAERAQHRRLAAALGDRERERAGHDEQRDRAGDAAHRPEDRDQRLAFRDARVAGIGVGRVRRIEHLETETVAQPFADRLRVAVGDHADRVDLPGRAGQPARGRRGEEHSGVTELPAAAATPLTRNVSSPPGEVMRSFEPTRAPSRASATTSADPRERGPSRSVYGVSCAAAQSWPSTRSPAGARRK